MTSKLVFLHFFGGSSRSWREVTARLADFACFAPDLRGFGQARDTPANWSVDEAADWVTAFIKAQEIERYTLVGHSMGGKIALALAARAPKELEGLVLLAPSPPTPEPMSQSERHRLLAGFGLRESAEETVSLITAHALPPALHELVVEDILRSKRGAWTAWLEVGSRENIAARMNRVTVPVRVVAGGRDGAMTPDVLRREVVERLANAQLHLIPDAAHLLPLEAPEAVADLIRGAF